MPPNSYNSEAALQAALHNPQAWGPDVLIRMLAVDFPTVTADAKE
jgi:hypothetical protein